MQVPLLCRIWPMLHTRQAGAVAALLCGGEEETNVRMIYIFIDLARMHQHFQLYIIYIAI